MRLALYLDLTFKRTNINPPYPDILINFASDQTEAEKPVGRDLVRGFFSAAKSNGMQLGELLEQEANKAGALIGEKGFMPAGHNGPYFDEETPVRNTAHWLFVFSVLYERTKDSRYKDFAEKAIAYLTGAEARPMKAAFWIRKNPEKDFCNGLIGQAWVMEALIKAAQVFDRPELYQLAEEVYLLHSFDEDLWIWKRLNVDGSYNSPDPTFNHQLWFGAVSTMLDRTPAAVEASSLFFEKIATRVKLYRDGVINHVSPVTRLSLKVKHPPKVVEGVVRYGYYQVSKRSLRKKAAGYHAFNLYAFALYSQALPDHPFWESGKFKKMLRVTDRPHFLKQQKDNKYSFPYNPTGLELAFVRETFDPDPGKVEYWLNQQIAFTGEPGKSIMTGGTADENTARARIYEAARLKQDYQIEGMMHS